LQERPLSVNEIAEVKETIDTLAEAEKSGVSDATSKAHIQATIDMLKELLNPQEIELQDFIEFKKAA
jgi:nucleoid DNA-binding protein